ncbi:replication endonuclease, partial [Janthinobacterium sp. LB2P10]|uniref:replication endonuclease n=1 Tax=Janthinobacterium sp. LB2P10 TaxID=3424194 RepID=UPI003F23560C
MPIIQQENGIRSVKGLPLRWGIPAYRELHAAQAGTIGAMPEGYKRLSAMLDEVTACPLPLDSTEAQLTMLAERCANECMNVALDVHDAPTMRVCVELVVRMHNMEASEIKDDRQAVARYTDPAWWRRGLRIIHGRAREYAAMRLGFVSSRKGKYCSDEAVKSRIGQRRRNKRVLENTTLENVETGQQFALDELVDKSTANPVNRQNELMLRMDGVDEVAIEDGHEGLFVTLTAPSAYHAVLESSSMPNPKYNGATPRETQLYMRKVWAQTRAQNARDGIAPYGFRVAEPHHDGCTHWHMMVFMPADHIEIFQRNLRKYALKEGANDAGAQTRRVKFEKLDPSKGTAAAYMMKYTGKNIDASEIQEDKNGRDIITKEMRVNAWAGVWGIRQFQAFGQPPVTPYREVRRVDEEIIADAPEHVRAAWVACNRLDLVDEETGEIAGQKKCSWAAYIRAQGGVNMGRHYRIAITSELRAVAGRYGMQDRDCPIGVHFRAAPDVNYASSRYTWRRVGVAVDVRVCRPWSPVNNCTPAAGHRWEDDAPWPSQVEPHHDFEYFAN